MRQVVFLLVFAVGGLFLLGGCAEPTTEKGVAPAASGDSGSTASEGPASTTTEGAPTQPAEGAKDIVDTAVEADGFKTLVAAVEAAGLVDTL
jgi:uncharacterized surface protein with fasciclin (FAS1) repeats